MNIKLKFLIIKQKEKETFIAITNISTDDFKWTNWCEFQLKKKPINKLLS